MDDDEKLNEAAYFLHVMLTEKEKETREIMAEKVAERFYEDANVNVMFILVASNHFLTSDTNRFQGLFNKLQIDQQQAHVIQVFSVILCASPIFCSQDGGNR